MPSTTISARVVSPIARLASRKYTVPWICTSCRQRLRRPFSTPSLARTGPESRPVYITTPIFYVNAAPHVGHMYTMIIADVLKRWHIISGKKALLCTGTDEHGMKIQRAAAAAATDPQQFCDKGAQTFKDLAERTHISHDTFIRTTDASHYEAVQYAWYLLKERGHLYESKHEGWYAVSDETFYPESEVHTILNPSTGKKMIVSKETGKEVEWVSEVNWKFRLSGFREQLLEWYEKNPNWILPKTRMEEIVEGIRNGADVKDLSVSRPSSRLQWGIPVPNDPTQTIYVWLDALINYITAAGYPWTPGRESEGGWPAYCQVIGKDITRFHCIYWPAFLMALDIPLPERFYTHGFWLLGKEKMAKSTGNVVNPFFALDRFGVDAMRCFLALHGHPTRDSSYSNQAIIENYQKVLQGPIGNLVARVLRGTAWNVRRAVVNRHKYRKLPRGHQRRQNFRSVIEGVVSEAKKEMGEMNLHIALLRIVNMANYTNAFFAPLGTGQEPWVLAKTMTKEENEAGANEELDDVIYMTAESLRIMGILLQPFMPGKAKQLLDMLGVQEASRTLEACYVGADAHYGEPLVPLLKGEAGVLFPPLTSDR